MEVPPAKRDDGSSPLRYRKDKFGQTFTTTPKSKKWYMPKRTDSRNGFRQAQNAQAGMQSTGKSKRSFLPGAEDLLRINYSLSEGINSNYYDEEEEQILRNDKEITDLIESLEKTTDETKP
jgi:hypothetical protein